MTPRGLEEGDSTGNVGDSSDRGPTSHAQKGPEKTGPRAIGVQGVTLSRAREEIAAIYALRVELDMCGDARGSSLARKLASHLRNRAAIWYPMHQRRQLGAASA